MNDIPFLPIPPYIAIEGVIGVGKTTLARMLAERFRARLVLEQFEDNPFLKEFYRDRRRFAFQTQLYFLLMRYRQQQELSQTNLFHDTVVSDYIFEKDKIFAYQNLRDDELALYEMVEGALERNVRPPDLVIYLQSDVDRLHQHIAARGRDYERLIGDDYLRDLVEAYNYFFFHYTSSPLLIIHSSDIDFVHRREDFELLVHKITQPRTAAVEYFRP